MTVGGLDEVITAWIHPDISHLLVSADGRESEGGFLVLQPGLWRKLNIEGNDSMTATREAEEGVRLATRIT